MTNLYWVLRQGDMLTRCHLPNSVGWCSSYQPLFFLAQVWLFTSHHNKAGKKNSAENNRVHNNWLAAVDLRVGMFSSVCHTLSSSGSRPWWPRIDLSFWSAFCKLQRVNQTCQTFTILTIFVSWTEVLVVFEIWPLSCGSPACLTPVLFLAWPFIKRSVCTFWHSGHCRCETNEDVKLLTLL